MSIVAPILALAFLTPWLMAAGAAATSIPIVIHLLNKRKFRVVVWAAMDWLLAAQRRNARRLRFQRWLLLAIRCLAILVIAAGIAEMVLQNTAFAALAGQRRATVILWDDSYSMGYQQNAGPGGAGGAEGTAFEKSKRLIADYIRGLTQGDQVMVIRASTGGPAASSGIKPTADRDLVLSQEVTNATLTDAATDLPTAFDRARQVLTDLEATTNARQLILVTDFTSSSIHDPRHGTHADNAIEGAGGDRLKKAAQGAIAHATDFRFVNLGADNQSNTAVTDLTTRRPVVVAGTATDLLVEIFNGSDQPRLDVQVSILVDGVPTASVKIPRIDPVSFQTAAASITVATPGRHLVEARLANSDALPLDDTRRLMLNVRKEIPILLVDGSPGDGGRTSYGSTFYLYAAYALPAAGKPEGMFAPKVISELELPTTPLANYDAVVLSDTSDLGPAMRDSLRKFVASGGLLMIFPGVRTNTQRMNEALGDNGAKLLPATLGQLMKPAADPAAQGKAFDGEGFTKNPVMQTFEADYKAGKEVGLLTVQTMQYYKLGVPNDGSTETILRYAEKQATAGGAAAPEDAAVVMRRGVGADPAHGLPGGNVVLFASTADMAWNTWGAKASYLPFMHELTFYGLGRGTINSGAGLTLQVGATLHLPGDVASAGPWNGPRTQHFKVDADIQDGVTVLSGPALNFAGEYGPATGDLRPVVAVNPDALREADVRHVPKETMAAALGTDVDHVQENPLEITWSHATQQTGTPIGAFLVLAALLLFLLESMLALAFSMYR